MRDVVRTVCDKLIRRHPHVFGDVVAEDSDAVLKNWEAIKQEERKGRKKTFVIGGYYYTGGFYRSIFR